MTAKDYIELLHWKLLHESIQGLGKPSWRDPEHHGFEVTPTDPRARPFVVSVAEIPRPEPTE